MDGEVIIDYAIALLYQTIAMVTNLIREAEAKLGVESLYMK